MTKDEALELALEALEYLATQIKPDYEHSKAITTIKAALEAKDEPYAFEASMYPRVIIDPVTGNVSIGTVTKPCGLECDCTDVCEQETDYKALWQQMCERCDELDKKLAQRKPLTIEQPKVRTGDCLLVGVCASEGHKIQPQRTWVGLTIDEREQIQQECFGKVPHHVAFAHAIEAKLKEKNT